MQNPLSFELKTVKIKYIFEVPQVFLYLSLLLSLSLSLLRLLPTAARKGRLWMLRKCRVFASTHTILGEPKKVHFRFFDGPFRAIAYTLLERSACFTFPPDAESSCVVSLNVFAINVSAFSWLLLRYFRYRFLTSASPPLMPLFLAWAKEVSVCFSFLLSRMCITQSIVRVYAIGYYHKLSLYLRMWSIRKFRKYGELSTC